MKNRWRYLVRRVAAMTVAAGAITAVLLLLLFYCAARGALSVWLAIGMAAICLAAAVLLVRWIIRPYRQTRKFLELFVTVYTLEGVYDMKNPYDLAMEQAMEKLRVFLSQETLIGAGKRQAQYLALQNQINPHFLYNTLEGIRGEALMAGLSSVAEMTEALATFFRYTISNVENFVTVEEELENVENYFRIQQFRFGDRLDLKILFDRADWPEIKRCRLPKLTLQPIAENSIIHGIERKLGRGTLTIKLELTEKRLLITVSDDGVGMEQEQLRALEERLQICSLDYIQPDGEKKGGIAVVNVNNRLRLLFGEEYGIQIYSTQGLGTDVEITLPHISKVDL